jgi:hypothetical protein
MMMQENGGPVTKLDNVALIVPDEVLEAAANADTLPNFSLGNCTDRHPIDVQSEFRRGSRQINEDATDVLTVGRVCRHSRKSLALLNADSLDLFLGVGLGFESRWTNLNPSCLGWTRFYDFALLRRLLLNDVVIGAGRGHQQSNDGSRQSEFLQHDLSSSGRCGDKLDTAVQVPKWPTERLFTSHVEQL